MIGSALRSLCAVLVGLVAATALVVAVEAMSSILHPFPPGVDPADPEVCKAHVARYPAGVLLLVALCWGLATLVGSWLATLLGTGRHLAHGIVVGSILLLAAIANLLMLPYPIWFWIVNLVLFPAGCLWGARLARARTSIGPEAAA